MDAISQYARNLRSIWESATAEDVQAGRIWYPMARGELYDVAREFRFSLKRTAFAAAALSNNMEWSQNVALLQHVCFSVVANADPHGHYARCLDKAVQILRDGNFKALSGPKVVPFAYALMGDVRAAVIDRWMYRAGGESGWPTERRSRDLAVALRLVAKDIRRSVSETQAIIWTTIQRASN